MEKRQAIEFLEYLRQDRNLERTIYGDALNIAIDALKTQLYKEDTTSDMISKTETVEHLRRVLDVTVPITDYDGGYVDGVEVGISTVSTMPTIQPEKRTEKRMETHGVCLDAISRKPAIDALDKQIKQCCKALGSLSLSDVDKHAVEVEMASLRAYRKMLENLPTVQPEPKEGHWIWVAGELMCSECRTIYSDLYPDYDNSVACPHCGAKMTISTK